MASLRKKDRAAADAVTLQLVAYQICAFANGSCECNRRSRIACEATLNAALVTVHIVRNG